MPRIFSLEPATRSDETIDIFGYRLPFRSIRLTNENTVTPLPKLPQNAKDAPGLFHLDPSAPQKLSTHLNQGVEDTLTHLPGLIDVEPAPPEQPPGTLPRFALTLHSDGVGLDVLDNMLLSLDPDVVPGTPPLEGKIDEGNLRRHRIINPSLSVGKRLYGAGTLSLRDPYPLHYVSPTEISLEARSEPLETGLKEEEDRLTLLKGSVRVNALGVAGVKGDAEAFVDFARVLADLAPLGLDDKEARVLVHELVVILKAKVAEVTKNPTLQAVTEALTSLDVDGPLLKSLESAIYRHAAPGTKPSVVEHAAAEVARELSGPGFSIHGPIYFGILIVVTGHSVLRQHVT